jgi:osmotically-inducible protein OsmY
MSIRTTTIAAAVAVSSILATSVSLAKSSSVAIGHSQDVKITHELRHELARDLPDSNVRLHISTRHGVVTLSGLADSGSSALKAIQDAQQIAGVKRVKNRMRIVS